jgi:hypothetical protein
MNAQDMQNPTCEASMAVGPPAGRFAENASSSILAIATD